MKNIAYIIRIIPLIILGFVLSFVSCNKDGGGGAGGSFTPTGGNKIEGIVKDANMNPLADVEVSSDGNTTTTDSNGEFILSASFSGEERAVVEFSKDGYFKNSRGFVPQENKTNKVNAVLIEREAIGNFDNGSGGNVSDNASKMDLTFESNAFVKENGDSYNGEVTIYGSYIDPDGANFDMLVPGGDLSAVDENNDPGMLISYGMVAVEAEDDNGDPLQLQSYFTGCVAIPQSMIAQAPDEMPVWFMANSTWGLIGNATKSGDQYCFTSTQTGNINCDLFSRTAIIKGFVCDNMNALANEHIRLGQLCVSTAEDGSFAAMVPSGTTINVTYAGASTTIGPFDPNTVTECVIIGDCPDMGCVPPTTPSLGSSTISGNSVAGVNGTRPLNIMYVSFWYSNNKDIAYIHLYDGDTLNWTHSIGGYLFLPVANSLELGTYNLMRFPENQLEGYLQFDIIDSNGYWLGDTDIGELIISKTGDIYDLKINVEISNNAGGGIITASYVGPMTLTTVD